MTNTLTQDAVEYAGAMQIRFFEMDITNYDDDSGGNGESFSPSDAGMNRFEMVIPTRIGDPTSGTGQDCVAQWNQSQESIRLYQQSDSSGADSDAELVEVPSNSSEGALVEIMAIGR